MSGTRSSSTSAPTCSAISPIADDRPPAPQSVIARTARRRSSSASISSFSVIGSPICTLAPATSPVVASIVSAGERGAADAVATGAPAEDHHAVAGVRAGRCRLVGRGADAAAEHERVGGVRRGRRGPHRRPSAARSCCRSRRRRRPRPSRMRRGWSAPSGSASARQVGRAEAQHVGDRDRSVGGAHHVADHAADAGVGPAERLDRRRVVVRLGLDGERRARGERRRCRRCRRTPSARTARRWRRWPSRSWRSRGTIARPSSVRDPGPEGLVGAVLAPRLGQRLQLDVGGVATLGAEVVADRDQLGGVERQPAPASSAASPAASRSGPAPTRRRARPSTRGARPGSIVDGAHRSITGLASTRRSRTSTASSGSRRGSSMRRAPAAARRRRRAGRRRGRSAAAAASVTPGCRAVS